MINCLTEEHVTTETHNRLEFVVRKAAMRDIAPILELINGYAAKGVMLPRTEFELSENIRDFTVIYSGSQLAGCGALHFYSPTMGEIRSLAVQESWKTHGVGRRLVEALVEEARQQDLHAVFAFTYVLGFFAKLGFHEVERGELPLKVWKDCLRCPKFECCDEIAVIRALQPGWVEHNGLPRFRHPAPDGGIRLPIVTIQSTAGGTARGGPDSDVRLNPDPLRPTARSD